MLAPRRTGTRTPETDARTRELVEIHLRGRLQSGARPLSPVELADLILAARTVAESEAGP